MGRDKCVLCHQNVEDILNLGEIKKTGKYSAHYYCLLLASTIKQSGQDDEGILGFLASDIAEEIKLAQTRVCIYCGKKGATIFCATKSCHNKFHLPCGIAQGTSHQFHNRFLSHCMVHRPRQKFTRPREPQKCPICYDDIDFLQWTQVLWAPCCRKSSYFHKPCLQQMALSAGYFFKCPCCNDNTIFQRTMKHYGVFIPDRDASWELVPNAFQELLYRHDECNAKVCLCAKGRQHSSTGSWTIVLCETCGSQGTHIACSKLKKKTIWQCIDCTTKTPEKPAQKSLTSTQSSNEPQPSTSYQSPQSFTSTNRVHRPNASAGSSNNAATSSNSILPASVRSIIPQSCSVSILPIATSSTATNGNTRGRKRKRRSSSNIVNQDNTGSTVNITRVKDDYPTSNESISVDSDSDVVVVDDDDDYKCLKTQDGSVLTVRKITLNNNQKIIAQGDLDISEPVKSTASQPMNFVISDVRSIADEEENTIPTTNKRGRSLRNQTNVTTYVNGTDNKNGYSRVCSTASNSQKSVTFSTISSNAEDMRIYQGVVYNGYAAYGNGNNRKSAEFNKKEAPVAFSKQPDSDIVIID